MARPASTATRSPSSPAASTAGAIASDGLTLESPHDRVTVHLPVAPSRRGSSGPTTTSCCWRRRARTRPARSRGCSPPACRRRRRSRACRTAWGTSRAAQEHFDRVYGVPVMAPTLHLEPGVVAAFSYPISGLLDVGCWPRGPTRGRGDSRRRWRARRSTRTRSTTWRVGSTPSC